jgi:hypothetical protein
MPTQRTEVTPKPAPKKLSLKRETLRRLTPAELRLAAGGMRWISDYGCFPRTNAWTGRSCQG